MSITWPLELRDAMAKRKKRKHKATSPLITQTAERKSVGLEPDWKIVLG